MGRAKREHTGRTDGGNVRDKVIEHVGRVTIYKRGSAYCLYYREQGKTVRQKVTGNLATARALASKVLASLDEGSLSPLAFTRITVKELLAGFIEYCEGVRQLAPRSVDRYRAALSHLDEYVGEHPSCAMADRISQREAEDFVKWLRHQGRTRNGSTAGCAGKYSNSGIAFILSTCRTAFNWGRKRRYLPPYSENPFSGIGIDRTRDRDRDMVHIMTPQQQKSFFETCDGWQKPIFLMLAVYGLRVGELTHLLVSDVHVSEATFEIRSKPEMFWSTKTQRERILPIPAEFTPFFERLINGRQAGFLFLCREHAEKRKKPAADFRSARAFSRRLEEIAEEARAAGDRGEKEVTREVRVFLRDMGQIPEKRVRQEFMKITSAIGCPELTRAHSMRHLFSTRVQEQGINPLLVQGILGHSTLDMTWKYTHFGMDAKRDAIRQMLHADPVLEAIASETDP